MLHMQPHKEHFIEKNERHRFHCGGGYINSLKDLVSGAAHIKLVIQSDWVSALIGSAFFFAANCRF